MILQRYKIDVKLDLVFIILGSFIEIINVNYDTSKFSEKLSVK